MPRMERHTRLKEEGPASFVGCKGPSTTMSSWMSIGFCRCLNKTKQIQSQRSPKRGRRQHHNRGRLPGRLRNLPRHTPSTPHAARRPAAVGRFTALSAVNSAMTAQLPGHCGLYPPSVQKDLPPGCTENDVEPVFYVLRSSPTRAKLWPCAKSADIREAKSNR
jgi:hypothetical protein